MSKLLVVDDEQSICWGLTRLGESLGHEVVAAASAEQALDEVKRQRPDAVILDVRLPGMDGLSAIEHFQRLLGSVPIIVITAYGDLQTAVEAIRRGAFDYIVKPFDVEKVKGALVRALLRHDSNDVVAPRGPSRPDGMIGSSAAMQEVYKRIALAAASEGSVLVYGESGTCKELAARAIHRYSRRADAPFVAVSVAALDSTHAESDLFGHVRGAFAGAEEDRTGLLAQAKGGTLFLDEVAEIPLVTQMKLLRALEHNEVMPVGGSQATAIDVRVISATQHDLLARSAEGRFRHDLLFRLGSFRIELPPLRARPEDISELTNYFLERMATEESVRPPRLTTQALAELESRPWYGNVRELRNAVEHALILARGQAILPEHLPPRVSASVLVEPAEDIGRAVSATVRRWSERSLNEGKLAGRVYDELLEVVEPPLLEAALHRHRGQCAAAARTLGIHRTTLRKKLMQHGLADNPCDDT